MKIEVLNDSCPLLRVWRSVKYSTIDYDFYPSNRRLTQQATEEIQRLYSEYLEKAEGFKFPVWWAASPVCAFLKVLRADERWFLEKVKEIVMDQANWEIANPLVEEIFQKAKEAEK
ncbi:MAG: hypothetical protein QXH08_06040 [Candidatus Hadarchaeales archaeon]